LEVIGIDLAEINVSHTNQFDAPRIHCHLNASACICEFQITKGKQVNVASFNQRYQRPKGNLNRVGDKGEGLSFSWRTSTLNFISLRVNLNDFQIGLLGHSANSQIKKTFIREVMTERC
jgi:hypothetical protein